MLFNPSKFFMLMLFASTSFMLTLAGSYQLIDPQELLRNSDDLWHDSMEVPDNRVSYSPIPKSKLQEIQQRVGWRQSEAAENVKKWLNNHVKSNNLLDSEIFGGSGHQLQAKRNGAGYMCHFKLCQQNLANSGKRRWNPASYD